jgi:hypothetical protein
MERSLHIDSSIPEADYMVRRDASFPAKYIVEEADPTSTLADVTFVTEGVSRLAPVFSIEVTIDGGRRWRGDVFGGRDPLSLIVNGPSQAVLLAVAGGVGYVVPVESPETYAVLQLRPVMDVLTVPDAHLLVCVGLTKLVAVASDGSVNWTSPQVAADGISSVRTTSSTVVVTGWDAPSHRDVETTLDLESGKIICKT